MVSVGSYGLSAYLVEQWAYRLCRDTFSLQAKRVATRCQLDGEGLPLKTSSFVAAQSVSYSPKTPHRH